MPAMDEPAAARRSFLAAQVAALEPLAFLIVAVPERPLDGVQVRREEDGSLALAVSGREQEGEPLTAEQSAALERAGFAAAEGMWKATPPADATAIVDVVERVLGEVFGAPGGIAIDIRHGSYREERAAEKKVEQMRGAIEPVLTTITGNAPAKDDDGDYLLDLGRARVFVAPRAMPGRPPIVRVFAITNAGLDLTPELGLFLARLNFTLMFGRFSLDAEHQSVWFDETLLGEHITDEELRFTVEMVGTVAAEWDQKIAQAFGGRTRQAPTEAPAATPPSKPGQGGYL